MNIPKYIIVHHTGGTDADPLADTSHHTAEIVDAYHKSKGWDGIGYNWYIEKSGVLKKGRDESKTGAHTIGYNEKSIGICLAGNFDATMPTTAQIITLTKLLKEKMVQFNIEPVNIVPHRAFATKTCYGKKLADDWARKLVLVETPPATPPVKSKEEIKKQIIDLVNSL